MQILHEKKQQQKTKQKQNKKQIRTNVMCIEFSKGNRLFPLVFSFFFSLVSRQPNHVYYMLFPQDFTVNVYNPNVILVAFVGAYSRKH